MSHNILKVTFSNEKVKSIIIIGVLASIFPFILLSRINAKISYEFLEHYEDKYYLPPSKWLKLFSLGYKETTADLIWIKAIAYFGEQMELSGQMYYLRNYIDTIISLDPFFKHVYYWAGVVMIYNSRLITKESVEASIHYLTIGLKRFPDDGELNYCLGFNYYYELPPFLEKEEEKRKARYIGVEYMRKAVMLGYGPSWLASAVGTEYQKIGKIDMALMSIILAYQNTEDPRIRRALKERLKELKPNLDPEIIVKAIDEFLLRWKAEFPYISPTLYMLLGPRPLINPISFFKILLHDDPRVTQYNELFSPYWGEIINMMRDEEAIIWLLEKEEELNVKETQK